MTLFRVSIAARDLSLFPTNPVTHPKAYYLWVQTIFAQASMSGTSKVWRTPGVRDRDRKNPMGRKRAGVGFSTCRAHAARLKVCASPSRQVENAGRHPSSARAFSFESGNLRPRKLSWLPPREHRARTKTELERALPDVTDSLLSGILVTKKGRPATESFLEDFPSSRSGSAHRRTRSGPSNSG